MHNDTTMREAQSGCMKISLIDLGTRCCVLTVQRLAQGRLTETETKVTLQNKHYFKINYDKTRVPIYSLFKTATHRRFILKFRTFLSSSVSFAFPFPLTLA